VAYEIKRALRSRARMVWRRMAEPTRAVAFAGPPGSGKSALIAALCARRPEAVRVSFDGFPAPSAMSASALADWSEDGADFARLDIAAFAAALTALKAGRSAVEPLTGRRLDPAPLLLVEAPLGRAHPAAAPSIDRLVWLDTPLDVALARNLRAWAGERGGPPAAWLDGYAADYLAVTRRVLVAQAAAVRPGADLVLDGSQSVPALVEQVLGWLP
jgi:uridine kinase